VRGENLNGVLDDLTAPTLDAGYQRKVPTAPRASAPHFVPPPPDLTTTKELERRLVASEAYLQGMEGHAKIMAKNLPQPRMPERQRLDRRLTDPDVTVEQLRNFVQQMQVMPWHNATHAVSQVLPTIPNAVRKPTADTPASLIPIAFRPYSEWAGLIRELLYHKGYRDLTDSEVHAEYMPVVLGRLPRHVSYGAPKRNLDITLTYLENYDVSHHNIHQLWNRGDKEPQRPTELFAVLKQQFQSKLPSADRETVRCLAWDALLKRLPQTMALVPLAMGITKYPTYDQLRAIDSQYYRASEMQTIVGKDGQLVSLEDTIYGKALQKLSSTVGQMSADLKKKGYLAENIHAVGASASSQSTPSSAATVYSQQSPPFQSNSSNSAQQNSGEPYRKYVGSRPPNANAGGGRFQGKGKGGFKQKRREDMVYPDRSDYCWYHAAWGEKARACRDGCKFFTDFPNAKLAVAEPPPQSTNNSAINTSRSAVTTRYFAPKVTGN